MNLDLCSDKKSATFEKKNEWIKAKYLIFQRINGKNVLLLKLAFFFRPLDRATLNLTTIKA